MSFALVALALTLAAPPGENRPPEFSGTHDVWRCHVGETCQESLTVQDSDGDELEVTAVGLPVGATFTAAPSASRTSPGQYHYRVYTFRLKAAAEQTGEFTVTFTASDGHTPVTVTVTLEIVEDWETYALPGLQAVSYWPKESVATGGYQGVSVECLGGAWAHRNNRHGPSHGRVYADLDLLFPVSGHGGNLYAYTLGADLTVERNPSRRFLLPYFGAEVGGVHSAALGNYFLLVPYAGVHLWADRSLWVNVSAGYALPGRDLDRLGGAWLKAGLNLSFW